MIPEVGQRFGPYEILDRLGSGGMGLVFRAWDGRLHREVAVKMLHADLTMPRLRDRFLREARAASALSDAHICTIFDIGEQNGELYLVMELLEGETLKDRIERGALPADEIVRYGCEVAGALFTAHAKGIIHRDIKPANIFLVDGVNGRCQTKVLDFGLAKVGHSRGRSLDLTTEGATVGTVAYMSPEQARGETLDARSDLFSLGVVMYEMATGQLPFRGNTSALVFVQLLEHAPDPMRQFNDSVPRDLERIVLKLLAKDRAARFQSGAELQEALEKAVLDKGADKRDKRARKAAANEIADDTGSFGGDPVIRGARAPETISAARYRDGQGTFHADRRAPGPSRGHLPERRRAEDRAATLTPPPEQLSSDGGIAAAASILRPVARNPTPVAPTRAGLNDSSADVRDLGIRSAQEALDNIETARRGRLRPGSDPRRPSRTSAFRDPSEGPARLLDPGSSPELTTAAKRTQQVAVAPRRRLWWGIGMAAAATLAVLGLFLSGAFRGGVATAHSGLLLTVIDNRTGDASLDGAVLAGLRLKLQQSGYLTLLGWEAFPEALRLMASNPQNAVSETTARQAAQRINASMYLYGRIQGARSSSSAPYTISIEVLDTTTNERLVSAEDTVASRQQIGDSLDRLATTIRSTLGETGEAIGRQDTPLVRQATVNPDALTSYATGEQAMDEGRYDDAVTSLQRAIATEPHFVQAQLGLAAIYRAQGAESAAAGASRLAQSQAGGTDQRTQLLAQTYYDVDTSGDLLRAGDVARQLVVEFPHDAECLAAEAMVLRLQGHLNEALAAAQQASRYDSFSREARGEEERALLELGRYDAVLAVEAKEQITQQHGGISLLAAYASGQESAIASQLTATISVLNTDQSLERSLDYATYLDNIGALAQGELQWRAAAGEGNAEEGGLSRRSTLLSQQALNRALAGECASALDAAHRVNATPRGPLSTFNTGVAEALCGEVDSANTMAKSLEEDYQQNTLVTGYLRANLRAAILLQQGSAPAAIDTLKTASPYDASSLTPYLRGLADLALHQPKAAMADFPLILNHRGAQLAAGNNVYAMAQLGLARAYAMAGDASNSSAAYDRFLTLWRDGDPNGAMIVEARAHIAQPQQ